MKKIVSGISYLLCISLIVAVGSFPSCHSTGGDADDEKTGKVLPKKPTDTVEISQRQIAVAAISIGRIEQKNIGSLIKATGQLVLPPSSQAIVSTVIAGTVKQILVTEGAYVKSGQVVAYIESPEFTRMQQDYLTTKSGLVYIEQEYERQKLLNDQNAGTGKVFQQAKANFLSEQEKLQTMATALKQLHIDMGRLNQGNVMEIVPLIAPLSGQVNHIYVTIGSPAEVNKPLLDVINDQGIYADLKIFEKDINAVKVGQQAELSLSGEGQQVISGTVYALNSIFETDNRVVVAHVRLNAAANHLVPGTYIAASIKTSSQTTNALPEDAVVSSEGKQFIFVALGDDDDNASPHDTKKSRFKKMEVITGQAAMGYVSIKLLGDLPVDAKVVIKGGRYILAESLKSGSDNDNDPD
jgi:cobalt-zinc-cadmium efflux system membrane fusion protein